MSFNINLLSEFLCLLSALIYIRGLRNSFWLLFIPFMVITLVGEILATLVFHENNNAIYNVWVLIQTGFTGYFFWKVNPARRSRQVIVLFVALFYLTALPVYSFWSSMSEFSLLLFTFDSLITVFFAFLFLLYVMNENDRAVLNNLRPALWATAGIVAFFSVSAILFNMTRIIRQNELTFMGIYIDNFVPQVLSLIMYGCFSFSFYLCTKIQER